MMHRQASFSKDTREKAKKEKKTMYRLQFNGEYDEDERAGSAVEMVGTVDHESGLKAYGAFLKIINKGKT